jgi:hypothetical protein
MPAPEQREPPPEAELAAMNAMLAETKAAQQEYSHFTQEQARAPHRTPLSVMLGTVKRAPLLTAPRAPRCVDRRIRAQQVDKIFKAAALAANAARIPLAKLAIQGAHLGTSCGPSVCGASVCLWNLRAP